MWLEPRPGPWCYVPDPTGLESFFLFFLSRLMCLRWSLSASSLHFFAWHVQSTPTFFFTVCKTCKQLLPTICRPCTVVGVLWSLCVCSHDNCWTNIWLAGSLLTLSWSSSHDCSDYSHDYSESLNSKAESQRVKLGKKLVPAIRRKSARVQHREWIPMSAIAFLCVWPRWLFGILPWIHCDKLLFPRCDA